MSKIVPQGVGAAAAFHLSLLNHVHEFDAARQYACAPTGLEPEHRSAASLDCPVILFDDAVQILVLADLERRVALGIEGL